MTAEPKTIRTKAEEALVAEYRAAPRDLPGGAAVRTRRDAAFALFEQSGLPHRRVEAWKYTDLRALMKTAAPLAGGADDGDADGDSRATIRSPGSTAPGIVVVNGVYRPDLSDLAGLDGVTVTALADVLANDARARRPPVRRRRRHGAGAELGAHAGRRGGRCRQGRQAGAADRDRAPDGGRRAGRGVRARRRHGRRQCQRRVSSTAIAARTGRPIRSMPSPSLPLARGANVVWARLQAEGDARPAHRLARGAARSGCERSTISSSMPAARCRAGRASPRSPGAGVTLGFNGATMLAGQRARRPDAGRAATPRAIRRAANSSRAWSTTRPRASSRAASSSQPDAQKTDAKMMTQALLLSETAQFASKPELEIFADDVQCGHGATSGRIDETQLFYLMARGVPRAEAERLLIEAFLDDAIDALGDEAIADALKGIVSAWLVRRGGGRLEHPPDPTHHASHGPPPRSGEGLERGAAAQRSAKHGARVATPDQPRVPSLTGTGRGDRPKVGGWGASEAGMNAPSADGRPLRRRGDPPRLSRSCRATVYGKPLVYLDNGASAQKPQAVIDAVTQRLHRRIRQRPSRPALPLERRDREIRGGARDRAPLRQRRASRRDHLHAQRHRGDQPRRRLLRRHGDRRGRRDRALDHGAPFQHRAVELPARAAAAR